MPYILYRYEFTADKLSPLGSAILIVAIEAILKPRRLDTTIVKNYMDDAANIYIIVYGDERDSGAVGEVVSNYISEHFEEGTYSKQHNID